MKNNLLCFLVLFNVGCYANETAYKDYILYAGHGLTNDNELKGVVTNIFLSEPIVSLGERVRTKYEYCELDSGTYFKTNKLEVFIPRSDNLKKKNWSFKESKYKTGLFLNDFRIGQKKFGNVFVIENISKGSLVYYSLEQGVLAFKSDISSSNFEFLQSEKGIGIAQLNEEGCLVKE